MRITHKVDYAVRALAALARAERSAPGSPVTRDRLAAEEVIPAKFLDDILRALRNNGLVRSHRGPDGGWTLGRPATEISVADVIRVLEGPLASVRGIRPDELPDDGVDEVLVGLWVAVRTSLRSVLEVVTVADLAAGRLPRSVQKLAEGDDAWAPRLR